jgi:tRNA A-37 threonylcarbamoyl transferase component Bud32
MSVDKNLLFGLVAYQNGYITQEQFFQAAQVWNKNQKLDIGQIFVSLGSLEEIEKFNIQGIVEDRLRRQGGLENSLSFVIENGSLPKGPELPDIWQNKIEEITKVGRQTHESSAPKVRSSPSIDRYVFRRTIGEGGQGIVWEVDDTELGRRIALKKVHPKHSNNPLYQGMLIEESRNTGRLDHAGIVPVYDLGQDHEGNPFFTMQLVRGEKLADRVKAINYESISAEEFMSQIRPLLRHLIAACNAIQYAYDKFKVIHRDVKPENIMVNRYGETVVMDWGMGKTIEDAKQLDEASSVLFIPVSGSGGGSERTLAGSVKGTLGYLSPEQARALNNSLDHRTDVYGLGATLYRILTGTVPYSGTSIEEALHRAKLNEFMHPRLRNSYVPKELEAICLKAMSTSPEDRFQRATDLGQDLENWIVGDPTSVLPDNLLKKSERWLRRHAKGVIGGLMLLSLTAAALLWATVYNYQKTQELNIANRDLATQQIVTKSSRDALSSVLDEVVGSIFDDQLSQIPDFEKSRIGMLQAAIDRMEGFVSKYPDGWDLKLDVVRLLTRLGNLQSEINPAESIKAFQRATEIASQAEKVPDKKLNRSNWLGASIDKEYYYGEFLLNTLRDTQGALVSNQACFDLVHRLMEHNTSRESQHGVLCRLHRQKSTIFEQMDKHPASMVEADLAVDQMNQLFGKSFLNDPLSIERVKQNDYADLLVFIAALDQRCTVLKNLNRNTQRHQSLQDLLRCCQIADRVPTAQRDARIHAIKALGELCKISISQHDMQQSARLYQETAVWIEKAIDDPVAVQMAMIFESDRATLLAPVQIQQSQEALDKAAEYLEELKPDTNPVGDTEALWYLSLKMHYNEAKLAVLLAEGNALEHQQLRDKQSDLEQQFEILQNKINHRNVDQ